MIKKLSKSFITVCISFNYGSICRMQSNEKENQKVADIEVKTIATKELQDKLSKMILGL